MKKIILLLVFMSILISFVNGDLYAGNIQQDLQSSRSFPSSASSASTPGVAIVTHIQKEKAKAVDERQCIQIKGCWDNFGCHPVGYRTETQYCYDEFKLITTNTYRAGFVNQTETGNPCEDGFECKTNLCHNNICVNIEEEIDKQVNQKFEELKQEIISQDNNNNNSEILNSDVELDKSFFKKIIEWVRGVFGERIPK